MNSNAYMNDKGMKKAPTIKWNFAKCSKNYPYLKITQGTQSSWPT